LIPETRGSILEGTICYSMQANIVCACRILCVTLYRLTTMRCLHFTTRCTTGCIVYAHCCTLQPNASMCLLHACYSLFCLQAIKSCSPCSLLSLTSTSVRVTWPKRGWFWVAAQYYTVVCTSTPGCKTIRVNHGTYSTDVTGLRAGTYYQFRVTNDRARRSGRPVHGTCAGTTGLCQCDLYIV